MRRACLPVREWRLPACQPGLRTCILTGWVFVIGRPGSPNGKPGSGTRITGSRTNLSQAFPDDFVSHSVRLSQGQQDSLSVMDSAPCYVGSQIGPQAFLPIAEHACCGCRRVEIQLWNRSSRRRAEIASSRHSAGRPKSRTPFHRFQNAAH